MAEQVQIRGGTRNQMDAFIGADRELTATTDSNELRLHDGETQGGHRFLPLTQMDARFQGKSPELTSIASLDSLGFLVRRGTGEVVTRKLTGYEQNIGIIFPEGFDGDPVIGLLGLITSEHTWEGLQQFTGGLIGNVLGNVEGNLEGSVTGNLTGNVTGNLTGNVIGDLTGDSFGSHQGSVDVRGATLLLSDGQIPLSAIAANLVQTNDIRLLPVGVIVMWAGEAGAIPDGWYLCDGSEGTPNLTDRFIIGAGGARGIGDLGGATQTTVAPITSSDGGLHTHPITVNGHALTLNEIPSHKHKQGYPSNNAAAAVYGTFPSSAGWRVDTDSETASTGAYTDNQGGGASHTHGAAASNAGTHSHIVTVPPISITPVYYALAFIQYKGE